MHPRSQIGQPVRITLDALPGKLLPGKVRRVAPYVSAVEKQARTVDVEVDFANTGRNRQAAGRLQRRRRDHPQTAATMCCASRRRPIQEGGKVLVFDADSGKLEERKIKAGLANWEFTEVLEGLVAGDRIVTSLEKEGVKAGAKGRPTTRPRPGKRMALIELKGIERVFQLGDTTVHALAGLDLRIDNGEYVAVMGPSGSGKSTLLNLLGLLDRPNAGTYLLEGRDVTTLSPDEQARVRSERIGFVFQSFHLVPRLTAAENIALPMILAGIPARERNARVAKALAGLRPGKPRRPPARPAFRRPAPARGDCPRDHHAAGA